MKILLFAAAVALFVLPAINCQEVPIPSRYEGMKIGKL